MNTLVIGRGGSREHALASVFLPQFKGEKTFMITDNELPISSITSVNIDPLDMRAIGNFVEKHEIELVVIGDELPLIAGVSDYLVSLGVSTFGASAEVAKVETQRKYGRVVCSKAGFCVPKWSSCKDIDEVMCCIDRLDAPWVVKSDGPRNASTVQISDSKEAAIAAGRRGLIFGNEVSVEEYIEGNEFSISAIVKNGLISLIWETWDYKRLFDDDRGPLTGGMGAVVRPITTALEAEISKMQTLVQILGLGDGFLTVNMIEKSGEDRFTIEVNVHLGSPEAEALAQVVPEVIRKAIVGKQNYNWQTIDHAGIAITLADAGYPEFSLKVKITQAELDAFDFYGRLTRYRDDDDIPFYVGFGRVGTVAAAVCDYDNPLEALNSRIQELTSFYHRADVGKQRPRTIQIS